MEKQKSTRPISDKGDSKLDTENQKAATALHLACQLGHTEAINILLNYGANLYAEDEKGRTPLDIAYENDHIEAVKLLINAQKKNDKQ